MSTTLPAGVTADRIAAQAAQVRFLPFLAFIVRSAFLGFFSSVGWLAGSAWFLVVYAGYSAYYGFMKGAHVKPPEPKQPSIPQ